MKTKHTKGPWVVRGNTVFDLKDRVVASCPDMQGELGAGEQNANGYLIAAAPDMLEVLERVEKHFAITAVGSLHNQQINDLRAVLEFIIKKARGES